MVCSKQSPFYMDKKSAVTFRQLRRDKTDVELSAGDIDKILAPYKFNEEKKRLLKNKLKTLKFDIDFGKPYPPLGYEGVDDDFLWEIGCNYYGKDIKKIKEHLLWMQGESIVGDFAKGFLSFD